MELDFSNDTLERLMLKKALIDKKWLNILSKVYDKRWFKDICIGPTLKNIIAFYNKYDSIPNIQTIHALTKKYIEKYPNCEFKLSDVQQLLTEVSNINLNLSDDVINANLKEYIRRNAFYNSLYDNAELLERSPDNYEKVVDKCLENFDKVQKITFNDTDLGLDYFDEESMKSHWEFIRNPAAKIKTGWESIDSYTTGGFLKDGKMLALFMAQAGLGKSVFLSNLGVNYLKQNLGVVVISLEMSQDVYAQRFDAHISQFDINKLNENTDSAIQKIKEFYKQYPGSNLYLKEYPPRSICSKDIEQYLDNLKNSGKKFDVIIIDYLNLVLPNRKTDSMFRDGLTVSEELRALSYKFNCPVVSAVQCNTEGMASAEIDMQNVSESRGIVHTVDALFALYQLDEDRENGIINLKVIKNRLGGKVGKHAVFKLDAETLALADITFDNNFSIDTNNSELGNIMKNLPDISSDLENI
jgi:replicative DNA helicase